MKILIKGGGDLATGIAVRLFNCGYQILMTEIPVPTTVRRTVAFSRCIYENTAVIEGITGVLCKSIEDIINAQANNCIAIIADPNCSILSEYKPDVLVDSILAKVNLGTHKDDAPIVIGVGPGFNANSDVHCVIETKRGHDLGRCIWDGPATPNSGIPGNIGGYTKERIIRASGAGIWHSNHHIGNIVKAGEQVGDVDGKPVYGQINGVIRGLLQNGVEVTENMKSGDIDPRAIVEHCFSVSDKARAIGGGVLEALLHLNYIAKNI